MPVKLQQSVLYDNAEARIEIVPLIDIMFFLLASFMLVSLSMVNLKSVKVNLPTATGAATDAKRDLVDISVDKEGGVYLDKKPVGDHELISELAADRQKHNDVRVFISGDRNATHGQIIHVLDLIHSAGIDKVAFEIKPGGS
ncbi:MAG: biopolymer transporter ExbD [Phycisphaerae bacterium]|nr:biopolymer transporter ExbD [Phycisphaerae bacterium]